MAFFKSLEYVLDVYLLLKFEEMSVKVLLKSLVSIIYAKLFEAIFLEPRKKKKKRMRHCCIIVQVPEKVNTTYLK